VNLDSQKKNFYYFFYFLTRMSSERCFVLSRGRALTAGLGYVDSLAIKNRYILLDLFRTNTLLKKGSISNGNFRRSQICSPDSQVYISTAPPLCRVR
jgi:hypothetical protein